MKKAVTPCRFHKKYASKTSKEIASFAEDHAKYIGKLISRGKATAKAMRESPTQL